MFSIKFNSKSTKTLHNLPENISLRMLSKIRNLVSDPIPHDAKKIINVKGKMFRIRIGDYRVLYVLNYEDKEIYISNIDKRERIY